MAHIGIDTYKCDATFIKSDITKKYNRGIVLINFNIPEDIWQQSENGNSLAQIARQIYNFLVNDVAIEISSCLLCISLMLAT